MNEWSVAGKVQGTWNESSREWTVHVTNGPRLLGGKGLQCLFVLGNEWSRERMFQGTNSLENEYSSIRSQRQLTKIGNYPFNTMQNNTIICKPRCKHKLHSHFSAVLSLGLSWRAILWWIMGNKIRYEMYCHLWQFLGTDFGQCTTVCNLDRSFHGTYVPWNCRSRYPGPFLPRTVRAFVSRAVPVLEQLNKQKRRPMTATVHSRYKFTAAVHC